MPTSDPPKFRDPSVPPEWPHTNPKGNATLGRSRLAFRQARHRSEEGLAIPLKAWFQREFDFDLPVWMYPHILERLRGTPARLEDWVRQAEPSVLRSRVYGKWSIQENIGHLADLELLWQGRLDDFNDGRETMRPADLTNRKTHEADHNARRTVELLQAFRQARTQLVGRLERCDESDITRTVLHPRLKLPMRLIDMAFFVAEHDDHHLARIAEIVRIVKA